MQAACAFFGPLRAGDLHRSQPVSSCICASGHLSCSMGATDGRGRLRSGFGIVSVTVLSPATVGVTILASLLWTWSRSTAFAAYKAKTYFAMESSWLWEQRLQRSISSVPFRAGIGNGRSDVVVIGHQRFPTYPPRRSSKSYVASQSGRFVRSPDFATVAAYRQPKRFILNAGRDVSSRRSDDSGFDEAFETAERRSHEPMVCWYWILSYRPCISETRPHWRGRKERAALELGRHIQLLDCILCGVAGRAAGRCALGRQSEWRELLGALGQLREWAEKDRPPSATSSRLVGARLLVSKAGTRRRAPLRTGHPLGSGERFRPERGHRQRASRRSTRSR